MASDHNREAHYVVAHRRRISIRTISKAYIEYSPLIPLMCMVISMSSNTRYASQDRKNPQVHNVKTTFLVVSYTHCLPGEGGGVGNR